MGTIFFLHAVMNNPLSLLNGFRTRDGKELLVTPPSDRYPWWEFEFIPVAKETGLCLWSDWEVKLTLNFAQLYLRGVADLSVSRIAKKGPWGNPKYRISDRQIKPFMGMKLPQLTAFDVYRLSLRLEYHEGEYEAITHVAVVMSTGEIAALPAPARHEELADRMGKSLDAQGCPLGEFGFMTSLGRFLGREDAALVASGNFQYLGCVLRGTPSLTSSDLW